MTDTPGKRTRKRVQTADPLSAPADESSASTNGAEPPVDPSLIFALRNTDGSTVLQVSSDGTAVFPPDSDLDELSRKFWTSVAGQQGVRASMRPSITIFISGPMQGVPDFNRLQFNWAASRLTSAGYSVLDPTTIEKFSPANPYDLNVRITLTALLHCNAVALLAGWQNSPAALREVEIANACGMTVAPLDYWLVEPS